eukprot:COSAG05_NODE_831_length_7083_cov_166.649055_4_plen_313_part_00
MCSVCEADYYAFRHNEEAGRCLSNSVTLLQAGFTATAGGIYRFAFSGELAPDLRSGTVTVPATAQLFLTGTGTEEVGASFVIDGGSLTLSNLRIRTSLLVDTILSMTGSGSFLSLRATTVPDATEPASLTGMVVVAPNGTTVVESHHLGATLFGGNSANDQCFQPYTTLRDSWRSTLHTQAPHTGAHGDCASVTGVGGGRWYRFAGAGGDALPLTSPGPDHCGTSYPGWLSGWASPQGGGAPPQSYSGAGRYPAAAEGVVERTVCFDEAAHGGSDPCGNHVQVGVVRCGGFLLWRLPYAPNCNGYCTAASGL